MIWAGLVSFIFFMILKKYKKLRTVLIYEIAGTDILMSSGNSILKDALGKMQNKKKEKK